jgi:U3 small nucleolar RNA-associated protein 22
MFIHPTNDYDFLLQLDTSMLPRYLHNVTVDTNLLTKRGKYANKTQEQDAAKVLPGFDPARFFFNDLQVRLFFSLSICLELEGLIVFFLMNF